MSQDRPRRLLQDESCHWYLIPYQEVEQFYAWVESCEDMMSTYDGPDYDEFRIDGPHKLLIHEWTTNG